MLAPRVFGRNLFDELYEDPWFNAPWFDDRNMRKMERKLYGHHGKNLMSTDVKETDKGYELEMDLPGFKKDEIQISLENGYVTIQAAKGLDKDEKDKKTGSYIRRERYAGACQRSFYVGETITQEEIKASFKHGILKLDIPKKEPDVDKSNVITIEG